MADPTSFQQALTLEPEADHWRATVAPHWTQGRSAFGGLVTALAYQAMQQQYTGLAPVRSLLTLFVGPVEAGHVDITTEVLRQGKNVTQVACRISQQGSVRATVGASFGASRDSSVVIAAPERPECAAPDTLNDMPYVDQIMPAFTQHFGYRWTEGKLPFSGSDISRTRCWVRFREEEPAAAQHLIALGDVMPSPAISRFKKPAPASSLTWMLEFMCDSFDARSNDWWFADTALDAAQHGYTQQQAMIYDPQGRAVAVSRQTVALFD